MAVLFLRQFLTPLAWRSSVYFVQGAASKTNAGPSSLIRAFGTTKPVEATYNQVIRVCPSHQLCRPSILQTIAILPFSSSSPNIPPSASPFYPHLLNL